MMSLLRAWAPAFLLCAGLAAPAPAQESPVIGTFRDWRAYVHEGGDRKTCYIASMPKTAEGSYTRRGDVWALVTRRSPGLKDVVSIVAGYNYREGSPVQVAIGERRFDLFTKGDTAWNKTEAGDKEVVEAMKAGVAMVVRGRSWRGTETTDTYSLLGFTAAFEAIRLACER